MTQQQLNYAYWQRMRQQELYRRYRATVMGGQSAPERYVKVAFAMSGGEGQIMCEGVDVGVSGKMVVVGGSVTVEAKPAPGYRFVRWKDDASAGAVRTFSNVVEDTAAEVELEYTQSEAGLWTETWEGVTRIFERHPGCRDNWELLKADGSHDPLYCIVYNPSRGAWMYEDAGAPFHSAEAKRTDRAFDVEVPEGEGRVARTIHFVWTATPDAAMLTVKAFEDGHQAESEDLVLENIRYDEGDPKRRLSYNTPWLMQKGQEVTLKASGKNGMQFSHWEDSSTSPTRDVTMDSAKTLEAHFVYRKP